MRCRDDELRVGWGADANNVVAGAIKSAHKIFICAAAVVSAGSRNHEDQGRRLALEFQGDFSIDGVLQDLQYQRFDSPYVQAQRKPKTIAIEHEGHALYLDFYGLRREVTD